MEIRPEQRARWWCWSLGRSVSAGLMVRAADGQSCSWKVWALRCLGLGAAVLVLSGVQREAKAVGPTSSPVGEGWGHNHKSLLFSMRFAPSTLLSALWLLIYLTFSIHVGVITPVF